MRNLHQEHANMSYSMKFKAQIKMEQRQLILRSNYIPGKGLVVSLQGTSSSSDVWPMRFHDKIYKSKRKLNLNLVIWEYYGLVIPENRQLVWCNLAHAKMFLQTTIDNGSRREDKINKTNMMMLTSSVTSAIHFSSIASPDFTYSPLENVQHSRRSSKLWTRN